MTPRPPIERPEFRAGLLDLLAKNAPADGSLQDVTDRTLHLGFAPYCDLPEPVRKEFGGLEVRRITQERSAQLRRLLIRHCNLRLYAQRRPVGTAYVAIYTRPPANSQTHLSRQPGLALAVVRGPAPARGDAPVLVNALREAVAALKS